MINCHTRILFIVLCCIFLQKYSARGGSVFNSNNSQKLNTVTNQYNDISIFQKVNIKNSKIGEKVTFEVVVVNEAQTELNNVLIQNIFTQGLLINSISCNIGKIKIKNDTIYWDIEHMESSRRSDTLRITMLPQNQGLFFSIAEIISMADEDVDSKPNNKQWSEDDISAECFNIPYVYCAGDSINLKLNVPDGYDSYEWFRDGSRLGNFTANEITITKPGVYTFNASVKQQGMVCQIGSCCPVIINQNTISNIQFTGILFPTCGQNNGKVVVSVPDTIKNQYSNDGTNFSKNNTFTGLKAGSYTFFVKDDNNCIKSDTITLTPVRGVLNKPKIIADKVNICDNETAILSASSCTETILWNTGSTNQSISVNEAGTYTAKCVNICSESPNADYIRIEKNPEITAPVVTANRLICCDNASATLTASGCNGSLIWNSGNTTSSITVTKSGIYTVTCQGRCGVTKTSNSVEIKAGNAQTPIILADYTRICDNQTITLTAQNCNGTIFWNTNTTGTKLIVNKIGVYWATCQNICGSGEKSNLMIITSNQNQLPTPIIKSTDIYLCKDDSVTLIASNCSETIVWNTGETGERLKVKKEGKYTASCTDFCRSSKLSNVIEIVKELTPLPPILRTSSSSICPGDSVLLTASGCNEQGFVWETTAQTGSVIKVNPFITTTYKVLCKNRCQKLESSITIYVEKNEPFFTITTSRDTVCAGDSVTLKTTGCAGQVYWANGLTGSVVNIKPTQTDIYSAVCSDTIINKCDFQEGIISFKTKAGTVGSDVYTSYVLSDTLNNILKIENAPTFTNVIEGVYKVWSITYSSTIKGLSIGNNIRDLLAPCIAFNQRTITVCASNKTICKPVASIKVTVNVSKSFTIYAENNNICKNKVVSLNVSECNGRVLWSNGFSTNSINVSVIGTYSAVCVNQCTTLKSNVITITATTLPPKLIPSALELCLGDSLLITAKSCDGIINWNTGKVGNTLVITKVGQYTATCTDNCGVSVAADTIIISRKLQCQSGCNLSPPLVSATQSVLCKPESIILSSSACNQGIVLWSTGQTGQQITIKPTTSSIYYAVCHVADSCTSVISNQIEVKFINNSKPIIKLNNTFACIGQRVTLSAEGCEGKLVWSNGISGTLINVTADANTTYTVKCMVAGCSNILSDTLIIPIGKPSQPYIYAKKTNICFGQNAILIAKGCYGVVNWSDGQRGEIITVTPTNPKNTYFAYCKAINGDCMSEKSNEINITVGTKISKPLVIDQIKNTCPFTTADLNLAILSDLKSEKNQFEFHIQPNANSLLITNPSLVTSGSYYVFERDEIGCYSDFATINVSISKCQGGVSPIVKKVDISVSKIAATSQAQIDDNVYYKIKVKNLGNITATGIMIRDIIPNELTYISGGTTFLNNILTIKIDSLKAGDSLAFSYKTKVTFSGKIINKAELYKINEIDTVLNNNSSEFIINQTSNFIGISKISGKPILLKEKQYRVPITLFITNQTGEKQTNIKVTDDLSRCFINGVTILNDTITVSTDSGLVSNPNFTGRDVNTHLLIDSLSSIENGKTAKINFNVDVDLKEATENDFYNIASLVSGEKYDLSTNGINSDPDSDGDPTNNQEPTLIHFDNIVKDKPSVGISLALIDSVKQDANCYKLTYMLLVKNFGNTKLKNVMIIDTLSKTFNDSVSFTINSKVLTSSKSNLIINPNFNGKDDFRLTLPDSSSYLNINEQDTVFFSLKLYHNNSKGVFYNNAHIFAQANYKIVNDTSNDGIIIIQNESTPTQFWIKESTELIIPQGFSPNGDGKNDTFIISAPQNIKIESFDIYNRWGGLVFCDTTGGITKYGWNGTANVGIRIDKKDLPDGTYFYVIKVSGQTSPKIGFIELVR